MKNSFITTKSFGFTLIELLVVVAILGIIAAVGITSYNGYVAGAKRKSAENIMHQISLGQTEYYSDNGQYYLDSKSITCSPSTKTSSDIEKNLLGGSDNINDEIGYEFCIASHSSNYTIYTVEVGGGCSMKMSALGVFKKSGC